MLPISVISLPVFLTARRIVSVICFFCLFRESYISVCLPFAHFEYRNGGKQHYYPSIISNGIVYSFPDNDFFYIYILHQIGRK